MWTSWPQPPRAKALTWAAALRPGCDCGFRCCGSGFCFFLLARLRTLAYVDAALEERAVFNRNARRHYVARERAIAANVDSVTRGQVSANLAQHHNLAGVDVRGHHAVPTDGHAVSCQIDRAFDAAIDVEGLRTRHLALNDQRLSNGGLIRRGR